MDALRRMRKAGLLMPFTERFGIRRADAGEFRADILALENETDGLLGGISLGSES